MSDAVDQGARLSGARSGNDEQRPVAVRGRGELLGVQLGREVPRLTRGLTGARRIDTWLLGHRAGIYLEARSRGGASPRFVPHRNVLARYGTTTLPDMAVRPCDVQ